MNRYRGSIGLAATLTGMGLAPPLLGGRANVLPVTPVPLPFEYRARPGFGVK